MLDRDKCFAAVATAVKGVVSDSVVDLKSPEVRIPSAFSQIGMLFLCSF